VWSLIDVAAARRETPGCAERVHFNNAGASLMTRQVIDTVVAHLELEARIGGYEAADAVRDDIEGVYSSAARLVNADPSEIALVENATRAWQAVFYGMRFRPGDRILTGRAEYCSNYMAYLQVANETGARIEVVDDDEYGQVDVGLLADTIDDRVKLISLTHVPTSGGLVNPAEDVGRVARAAGVPFLLDACQSVGQMPIDVKAIGCDFLSTTGRKFLRAPRGTGFLYASSERMYDLRPAMVEVGGAAWSSRENYTHKSGATRFETWETSYALRLGLGRAIDDALRHGLERIWSRVFHLAASLRERLSALPSVTLHDLGAVKCGIVTFSLAGLAAEDLKARLGERGINVDVSTPEDTRLDFESRKLEPFIRASVHYFNTDSELNTLCETIADVAREMSRSQKAPRLS
jgi:selenocysteine lyase/cysteine desulfurase